MENTSAQNNDFDQNSNQNTPPTKQEIKDIWQRLKGFLTELLDIRQGAEPKITIEGIKKDIPFKGHTAWILVFSIFIASIGLNTNSAAVVIGAMLISPLMGPILGIGLSIGINDIETLRRSLVNFGVMVLLSVLTAFVYFKISPFQIPSNEILNRTEPTLLDVLIAIFGGLAGIVAGSRKEKSNAIPGVAIATALMPPLCTAGFGLATGNYPYFFGALYLFGINTVFIALSTFVVVKYLRFPLAKYATAAKRKKVNRAVILVALVVVLPSVYTFYQILDRTLFEKHASVFLEEHVNYPGAEMIKNSVNLEKREIDVYLIGESVPQGIIEKWQKMIAEDEDLEGTKLNIRQGQDKSDELATKLSDKVKQGVLQDLYRESNQQMSDKDARIALLENEIKRLASGSHELQIPLQNLAQEAKINYTGLVGLSYAEIISTDLKKVDTTALFTVKWSKKVRNSSKPELEKKLAEWLKFKLKNKEIKVKGE